MTDRLRIRIAEGVDLPGATGSEATAQLRQLFEQGLATKSVAHAMFLTRGTVRNDLSTIMTKMDATTRAQAVSAARGNGWL